MYLGIGFATDLFVSGSVVIFQDLLVCFGAGFCPMSLVSQAFMLFYLLSAIEMLYGHVSVCYFLQLRCVCFCYFLQFRRLVATTKCMLSFLVAVLLLSIMESCKSGVFPRVNSHGH